MGKEGDSVVAQSERWEGSEVEKQERYESIGGKVGYSLFHSRVGAQGETKTSSFCF